MDKEDEPIKKNELLPFVTTWMDFEGLKLSERSRAEKDKHYVIHMYNLKKKKIKPVNKTKKK